MSELRFNVPPTTRSYGDGTSLMVIIIIFFFSHWFKIISVIIIIILKKKKFGQNLVFAKVCTC